MRRRLLALVGASLAMGALSGACGGDDKKNSVVSPSTYSSEGESCARTNDCKSPLVCVENRCVPPSGFDSGAHDSGYVPPIGTGGTNVVPGGSGGSAPVGVGGTIVTTDGGVTEAGAGAGNATPDASVAVRLSELGQSCTRTSDCAATLVCQSQMCVVGTAQVDSGSGEATTIAPRATRLSGLDETCRSTDDCDDKYVCVPPTAGADYGTCQLKDYGIEPTGKACYECKADVDCCELPRGLTVTLGTFTDVESCRDLINALDADGVSNPDTDCVDQEGETGKACLYYNAYCKCKDGSNVPWKCDQTAHTCSYTAGCEKAGEVMNGCPSFTRTRSFVPACDVDGTKKCVGGAAPACVGGSSADPCFDGKNTLDTDAPFVPVDLYNEKPCSKGECTCAAASSGASTQCYRKCNRDLDCPTGDTCKTVSGAIPSGSKLCQPAKPASWQCSADADCPILADRPKQKCDTLTHSCKASCTMDRECGNAKDTPLGSTAQGMNGSVCSAKGFCEPVGCSSDDQCTLAATQEVDGGVGRDLSVRRFCLNSPTTAPGGNAAAGFRSAVTGGPTN